MGIGYDVLKLAILVWFLAPFGYNASDVLFENVIFIFITGREDHMLIVGTNSPQYLPYGPLSSLRWKPTVKPVDRFPGQKLETIYLSD